jgi:radical SAM superfamily enzyme YgiQ (UPF0313 family)
MLVSERFRRVRLEADDFDNDYEVDGWSVWQLKYSEEGRRLGGVKAQGMRKWKVEYGSRIVGMGMCPRENVIAIFTK